MVGGSNPPGRTMKSKAEKRIDEKTEKEIKKEELDLRDIKAD